MLPVGWLVAIVVVAILLTMWVTFTLTRLDRLHARVDAAQAALDAQLVRRAAALQHLADAPDSGVPSGRRTHYAAVARAARAHGQHLDVPQDLEARRNAENAVGHVVAELATLRGTLRPEEYAELGEAAARVLISRRFYNDAVRDTRALRSRRLPRLFRMAGRRAVPEFFDIDDTLPTSADAAGSDGTLLQNAPIPIAPPTPVLPIAPALPQAPVPDQAAVPAPTPEEDRP